MEAVAWILGSGVTGEGIMIADGGGLGRDNSIGGGVDSTIVDGFASRSIAAFDTLVLVLLNDSFESRFSFCATKLPLPLVGVRLVETSFINSFEEGDAVVEAVADVGPVKGDDVNAAAGGGGGERKANNRDVVGFVVGNATFSSFCSQRRQIIHQTQSIVRSRQEDSPEQPRSTPAQRQLHSLLPVVWLRLDPPGLRHIYSEISD